MCKINNRYICDYSSRFDYLNFILLIFQSTNNLSLISMNQQDADFISQKLHHESAKNRFYQKQFKFFLQNFKTILMCPKRSKIGYLSIMFKVRIGYVKTHKNSSEEPGAGAGRRN